MPARSVGDRPDAEVRPIDVGILVQPIRGALMRRRTRAEAAKASGVPIDPVFRHHEASEVRGAVDGATATAPPFVIHERGEPATLRQAGSGLEARPDSRTAFRPPRRAALDEAGIGIRLIGRNKRRPDALQHLGGRQIVLQCIARRLLGGRQESRHPSDIRQPVAGSGGGDRQRRITADLVDAWDPESPACRSRRIVRAAA